MRSDRPAAQNARHRAGTCGMSDPIEFTVYDGRYALGIVQRRGDRHEALMANGRSLGLFNTPQAAVAAVSHEYAVRCDPAGAA